MVWGPAGVARPIAGWLYWPHPTWDPHRPAEFAGGGGLLCRPRSELLSVTAARGRPSVARRLTGPTPSNTDRRPLRLKPREDQLCRGAPESARELQTKQNRRRTAKILNGSLRSFR